MLDTDLCLTCMCSDGIANRVYCLRPASFTGCRKLCCERECSESSHTPECTEVDPNPFGSLSVEFMAMILYPGIFSSVRESAGDSW